MKPIHIILTALFCAVTASAQPPPVPVYTQEAIEQLQRDLAIGTIIWLALNMIAGVAVAWRIDRSPLLGAFLGAFNAIGILILCLLPRVPDQVRVTPDFNANERTP